MSEDQQQANSDDTNDVPSHLRKEVNARDEKIRQLEERARKAEKELAFRSAGVDPTKGVGALMRDALQGDVTVELIKQKAEEYGIDLANPGSQEAPGPQATAEVDVHQQIDAASGSAEPAGGAKKDPSQAGWEAYETAKSQSASQEAAAAAFFAGKFQAVTGQGR